MTLKQRQQHSKFQSTLPRRERPYFRFNLSSSFCISIHAPAKGATRFQFVLMLYRYLFQSTLPRRERRMLHMCFCNFIAISIHAPAKGATIKEIIFQRLYNISIHAPAKGATANLYKICNIFDRCHVCIA